MQPSVSTADTADTDTRAAGASAERSQRLDLLERPERPPARRIAIAAVDADAYTCDEPTLIYETDDGQIVPCVGVSRSFSSRVATELRYLTFAYRGTQDSQDSQGGQPRRERTRLDTPAGTGTILCDTEEIHSYGNDLAGVLRYGDMLWEPLAPLSYTGVSQMVLDRLSFSYVPAGPAAAAPAPGTDAGI